MNKKLFTAAASILMLLLILSCRNNFIPLEKSLLDKAKDDTAPVIVITSPVTESLFDQTVIVEGTISDNGNELPVLRYSVINDLGEEKSGDTIELQPMETESGVKGSFSFSFTTSNMDSDVLLHLTAVDWNSNEKSAEPLRLLYPGSAIPSFSIKSGNDQIELLWEAVEGASGYNIYYSSNQDAFLESTSERISLTAEEFEDSMPFVLNKTEHGINNGTLTRVRVKAESESDSWTSPLLSVVPLSPFSLIPRSNCFSDRIELSWKKIRLPDTESVCYTVWRSDAADGTYSRISPDNLDQPFFRDTNVSPGQVWYYRIGYTPRASVTADLLSEPIAASPVVLSPDLSSGTAVQQLLTSGTNKIQKVAFSRDGSRAFAVNYVDGTHSQLVETDLSSGRISGSPIDIQAASTVTVYDLVVTDQRVYVAVRLKNGSLISKILSFDISFPGRISPMDSENKTFSNPVQEMRFGNPGGTDTLFIYCQSSLFYSVDISTPETPGSPVLHSALNGITSASNLFDMEIAGEYLYILHRTRHETVPAMDPKKYFYTYHLTTYNTVSRTGSTDLIYKDLPYISNSDPLPLYGKFCLTADETSGKLIVAATGFEYQYNYPVDKGFLWSYDISADPANPSAEQYREMAIRIEDIKMKGSKAYCSTYNGSILIVEISSSGIVKSSDISARGNGVCLDLHKSSNRLIAASGSSAASLVKFAEYPPSIYGDSIPVGFGGIGGNGACFDGSFLYVPNNGTPKKLNVFSAGSDGTLTKHSELGLKVKNVLVRGQYLFTGYSDLTVSRMTTPGRVDNLMPVSVHLLGDVNCFDIWGDYLYVSEGSAGVEIFNISDPAAPVSVGWANSWSKSTEILVADDRLYMVDNDFGLRCYDVSVPEKPVHLGDFCDESSTKRGRGVSVSGDYVYYATDTGLFVLPAESASNWRNALTAGNSHGSAVEWIENDIYGLEAEGDLLFTTMKEGTNCYLSAFDIQIPRKPELFYMDYNKSLGSMAGIEVFGNSLFAWMEHQLYPVVVVSE